MIAGVTFGESLEIIRPWLTPAFLLAILGVITRHYVNVRKANTADLALSLEAKGDTLKTYAKEVSDLRDERRRDNAAHRDEIEAIKKSHRSDMTEMERRNKECDEDRHLLREKVDALRDLVAGYGRVIVTASKDKVIALGDFPSEEVQRAARRVDVLFSQGEQVK